MLIKHERDTITNIARKLPLNFKKFLLFAFIISEYPLDSRLLIG